MKKVLFFIIAMVCTVTGARAENASWNNETKTLTTNDDHDLANLTLYDWCFHAVTQVNVSGEISPTGLYNLMDIISNVILSSNYADLGSNAKLNLTGATISGSLNTLGNNSAKSGRFTSVLFPAGTNLSGISFEAAYNYAYAPAASGGQYNLYVSDSQNSLPAEVTADLEAIKTNGIVVMGEGADEIIELLKGQGVDESMISQPYNGKATANGGFVERDVISAYTNAGATAADVKKLTVSGTLTDPDITYITGTLTGLTTVDLSNATATGEQIWSLLDNGHITSIVLGSANIDALKTVTDKTFTSDLLAKISDGVTAVQLANGMTNTNYFVDGTTLIVTGEINSSVEGEIVSILEANSGITILNVENATNEEDYIITDKGAQINQVYLPENGKVTYGGNALTFVNGMLEVTIPDDYASVQAMINALGSNVSSLINIKIKGSLTSEDLSNLKITNLPKLKLIDLSDVTLNNVTSLYDALGGKNCETVNYTSVRRSQTVILPIEAVTPSELQKWQDQNDINTAAQSIAYYLDENKKNLAYWAGDGGRTYPVNEFSNLQSLLDGDMTLSFMKCYNNGSSTFGAPNNMSTLLTTIGDMEIGQIDFGNINISSLLNKDADDKIHPDFSMIKHTHYIMLPINNNGSEYDFTKETTSGGKWKYNDNIWVVGSTFSPNGRDTYYLGGSAVSPVNETTSITYIRPVGVGKLDGAHKFLTAEQINAERLIVCGNANYDDLETMKFVQSVYVDLSDVKLADGSTATAYTNNYVQYLALPDGTNSTINATSPDEFAYKTNCPNLKAIGAYDPTTKTYTIHSTERTVTYGEGKDDHGNKIVASQENSIYRITEMCAPNTSRVVGMANGTENLVASGYLTLDDIHANGGVVTGTTTNDQNQPVDVQSGQAGLESNNSCTIKTADFKNAVFLDNSHMNFLGGLAVNPQKPGIGVGACWANILEQIILPTDPRVYTIPRGALNNCKSLTEICIPYNFEHLCDGVFDNGRLDHITTTDANGALIDNGDHTFTFSANLKELGEKPAGAMQKVSAQVFPHNTVVYEVYCLATTTPKCYRDVFPANMLAGWGSFNNKIYSREKYMGDPDSDDGSGTYTVLRFPSVESYTTKEAYNDNAKLYTDVNKIYTKKDQTGAVDANGEAPLWPTQKEAYRTFAQASLGLTWNDWQTGYDINLSVNGPDGKLTGAGGSYSLSDVSNDLTTNIDANAYNYLGSIHSANSDGDYDFTNYEGWHQFVLTMPTYVEPAEIIENETIIRDYTLAGYYTLCIPFDLTVSQVAEMLGVPASDDEKKIECRLDGVKQEKAVMPKIYQLAKVTRKKGSETENNVVNFILTENLYKEESGKTYYLDFDQERIDPQTVDATVGDGNANRCIVGGRPYIVEAYKRKVTLEEGQDDPFEIQRQNLGMMVMTRFASELMEDASCVHNGADYYEQLGTGELKTLQFAKPYEKHKVRAFTDASDAKPLFYKDKDGNEHRYVYTMVGQFWQQTLPLYSIYMSNGKWYRYKGKKDRYGNLYTWDPYKCIIMATEEVDDKGGGFRDEEKTVYPAVKSQGKATDYVDGELQIRFLDGRNDDDFGTSYASSSRYVFSFGDDIVEFDEEGNDVNAIESLDGEYVAPVKGSTRIYTVAGQYVGRTLEGLGKGVYIVNGKKVVVK